MEAQAEASGSGHTPKRASSVRDINDSKPPFGCRFLTDENDVWTQNAWDHVPPPQDQEHVIAAALAKQKLSPVPDDEKIKYHEKPAKHWDNFYKMNASNFFRNRKWLHLEFPELVKASVAEAGPMTIAEIGCGAGNAVFPLLAENRNPHLALHAYDYSSHAVKLVQTNPLYLNPPIGSIKSAVWDLSSSSLPSDLAPASVDIVILVFVLSALHPEEWSRAVANIHKMLKPGGLLVLRDYGRHDLTQLRFKGGRLLEDNFYIRGDKTRVYFFELEELALLFTGARIPTSIKTTTNETRIEDDQLDTPEELDLELVNPPTPPLSTAAGNLSPSSRYASPSPSTSEGVATEGGAETASKKSAIHPSLLSLPNAEPRQPLFAIEQLGVDRRLIVNRKRQLKMYRVWMQGKFRKLEDSASESNVCPG